MREGRPIPPEAMGVQEPEQNAQKEAEIIYLRPESETQQRKRLAEETVKSMRDFNLEKALEQLAHARLAEVTDLLARLKRETPASDDLAAPEEKSVFDYVSRVLRGSGEDPPLKTKIYDYRHETKDIEDFYTWQDRIWDEREAQAQKGGPPPTLPTETEYLLAALERVAENVYGYDARVNEINDMLHAIAEERYERAEEKRRPPRAPTPPQGPYR